MPDEAEAGRAVSRCTEQILNPTHAFTTIRLMDLKGKVEALKAALDDRIIDIEKDISKEKEESMERYGTQPHSTGG
uniref:Kinesin motor domain-containing protein n=1 Tax=Steinernema glaseri TaxID=37863 RepID=A0A1I8ADN4_9BILA